MLSILKKINPDFTASGVATVIAVFAIMIALSSDSTPCASANAGCTVGQDPTFTGDIAIQSDTIYNATIGHNLSAPGVFNLVQPGYNHTGNLAVIDSANDLNIGGAVVLGSSLTSTLGSLRFDSDQVQVYNSTGSWVGVGQSPTNDIGTVAGDTGSFSASTPSDSISIVGSGTVSTAIVGDTLTISASAPSSSTEFANFSLSADQTYTYGSGSQTNIDFNTENFDTENCFSRTSSGTITYDSGCSSAYYQINTMNIINFTGLTDGKAMIQGGLRIDGDYLNYRTWTVLFGFPNFTLNTDRIVCLDPSYTIELEFFHGAGYSTGDAKWRGGYDDSSMNFIKLSEKGSSC